MDAEAKHTPGPWSVGPTHRESEGKTWLSFSYQAHVLHPNGMTDLAIVETSEAEGEANARLIAAAPDLLAELIRLKERLNDMAEAEIAGDIPQGSDLRWEAKSIDKVIAKATPPPPSPGPGPAAG